MMTTSHLDSMKCRLQNRSVITANEAFLLIGSSVNRKLKYHQQKLREKQYLQAQSVL